MLLIQKLYILKHQIILKAKITNEYTLKKQKNYSRKQNVDRAGGL